jgi:hypothetical protein
MKTTKQTKTPIPGIARVIGLQMVSTLGKVEVRVDTGF